MIKIAIAISAIIGSLMIGLSLGKASRDAHTEAQITPASATTSSLPIAAASVSVATPPPVYAFNDLGARCQQGVARYKKQLAANDSEAKKAFDASQKTVDEWKKWEENSKAELDKHWQANKNGLSSDDPLVVSAVEKLMKNIEQETEEINEESQKKQKEAWDSAKKTVDSLTTKSESIVSQMGKLNGCIESVARQQNFSPAELSEINSLLSSSSL